MAVGQKAYDQPFHQVSLAHDNLAQFIKERPHKGARFLHRVVNGADSRIHYSLNITVRWTRKPEFAFKRRHLVFAFVFRTFILGFHMKLLFATLGLSATLARAEPQPTNSFPLWPNGAPGALGSAEKDIPTLTPFFPDPAKATG